jgi:hypothetical protein
MAVITRSAMSLMREAREIFRRVFQDEAVVDDEGLGDRAGGGGESAAEGDHDGVSGEGAAVEQLGHAGGVGGGEPEGGRDA